MPSAITAATIAAAAFTAATIAAAAFTAAFPTIAAAFPTLAAAPIAPALAAASRTHPVGSAPTSVIVAIGLIVAADVTHAIAIVAAVAGYSASK
jgi:hypothetical protein